MSVVESGPEQARTLNFKELEQARKDAVAAEDEFGKRKKEYQDKNLDAINRVIKAEQANQKPKGKDAEIQVAWSKWREEQKDYSKKVVRSPRQAEQRAVGRRPERAGQGRDRVRRHRVHEDPEGLRQGAVAQRRVGHEAVQPDAAARRPQGRRQARRGPLDDHLDQAGRGRADLVTEALGSRLWALHG